MARSCLLAALALVTGLGGCLPESVEVVRLTPTTPELAAVLLEADARWEAAGVDPDRIQIVPEGGAPVRLVPERCDGAVCVAETRSIAAGDVFRGVRWIELYSLELDVATHELGHALQIGRAELGIAHLPEADCGGDDRPLMCAHNGNAISGADLELACTVGHCSHFTPER